VDKYARIRLFKKNINSARATPKAPTRRAEFLLPACTETVRFWQVLRPSLPQHFEKTNSHLIGKIKPPPAFDFLEKIKSGGRFLIAEKFILHLMM
jgi:hypothetical protein